MDETRCNEAIGKILVVGLFVLFLILLHLALDAPPAYDTKVHNVEVAEGPLYCENGYCVKTYRV